MDSINRRSFGLLVGLVTFAVVAMAGVASAGPPWEENSRIVEGKELFTRVWQPKDKRSFAGDGLGPVFNAHSCAECHKQGGIGGAGPQELNPMFVTAFVQSFVLPDAIRGIIMNEAADQQNPLKQPDRIRLAEIHPFLRTESSFPIHRFGRGSEFAKWQTIMLAEFAKISREGRGRGDSENRAAVLETLATGQLPMRFTKRVDGVNVALILSQRNTPALFGVGQIDRIPDQVLESVTAEQAKMVPFGAKNTGKEDSSIPVSGRVARLKDGRIGRFGWKANVATLREFTLQACSSELGLEVPGFPKSPPAWNSDYKSPGLDMTAKQCDALVGFVASLPSPRQYPQETVGEADLLSRGHKIFTEIGCATCHRPDLGSVKGIYSDLLLHDMGQSLSDAGSYNTNPVIVQTKDQANPLPVSDPPDGPLQKERHPKFGAGALEWRTPPLWGLRDSGPYLHDGRARDIQQAISQHDGEGAKASEAYGKLTLQEREALSRFLLSLAAPSDRN